MKYDVALTETARIAVSINDKHREVQRLGRTQKEIAAEIGEELIEVKQKLAHGEFEPWCTAHLAVKKTQRFEYMKLAKLKSSDFRTFVQASSINEALQTKPKPTPKQGTRAATLDDLRKVERLRALRDDPSATEGEKANAQVKLDEIEKEIGKVEPCVDKAKKNVTYKALAQQAADIVMSGVFDNQNARDLIQHALLKTYGDDEARLKRLVSVLNSYKTN